MAARDFFMLCLGKLISFVLYNNFHMRLLQDKNFQTRTLTGFFFVGVIIASVFIHVYTFYILAIAITGLCLYEFYSLTLEENQPFFRVFATILGVLPITSIFLCEIVFNAMQVQRILFMGFATGCYVLLFLQLFYRSPTPFANIAFAFLGYLYVSASLLLFVFNVDAYYDYSRPVFAILLFILVWVNDTGAYIAGSLFGKTRLFERISPKKSWEGTIGGLVLCMLIAAPYGKYVLHSSPLLYCGLGLTIAIFSTLGDLIESQLKRSLNIKDSGRLLPGHGGFLDRFDGFLMAMPAAYLYMLLVK